MLAAAATGLAGLGLGTRDGARAAASCTAALRSGDGVVVEGEVGVAVRAGARGGEAPGARWVRLELFEARLGHGTQVCRLPRLLVRVLRPSESVPAGARVRMAGEWRRFAPAGRRAPRAPGRYGAAYGTLAPGARAEADGTALPRRLRARMAVRLESRVPPDALPAAKALVTAERSDLTPAVTRRFADAGMIHLLAISGLHVGLLAGGALWAAGLVLGRRTRWMTAALVTGAYVAVIGAPAPAVRAALLFAGVAVTRMRGSPGRPGDLLGWAVGITLVASPLLLADPGYQLSFAGWAGLLAGDRTALRLVGGRSASGGRPGVGSRLRRRLRGPARALGASLGAFLATAPIAAIHFGRVAPASILSSLAGAPLVGLALAGLIPAVLLPSGAGALFAAGAAVPIRGLLRLSEWFAALPLHGSTAPPDAVAWGALLLIGVGGALLLAGGPRSAGRAERRGGRPAGSGGGSAEARAARRVRARGVLCWVTAAAIWTAAPGLRALGRGQEALLCTLDVGQGDAAVLRTRRNHWIVFDAGPGPGFGRIRTTGAGRGRTPEPGPPVGAWDAGTRVVVPFLRERGARAVDLFVLSHPHLDHLGGGAALFEAFRVRRVLDAGAPVPSGAYLRYLGTVEEEGTTWLPARAGARVRMDEVEILVLGPPEAGTAAGGSGAAGAGAGPRKSAGRSVDSPDPNDVSVAVRVRIGETFVYLNTGDAPAAAEAEMLRRWSADSLGADLVKLGHHGSRTSSSVAWLEAVRPRLAVISVGGRNRYGHPHPVTLARLDSAEVPRLWRTDRDGTLCVRVEEDGSWRLDDP